MKSKILVALLALATNTSFAHQWESVFSSPVFTIHADFLSKKIQTDGYQHLWMISSHKEPQKNTELGEFKSLKRFYLLDCKYKTVAIKQMTYYAEEKGEGAVLRVFNVQESQLDFEPIVYTGIWKTLQDGWCGK